MKWELIDCTRGDMIRVNLGSVFHYGIYVSDDEVIQFGYPPILRNIDKDRIVVVATDIATFSCGKIVEVASLTYADKRKRFNPEVVVENARERIGEEGYNIIHNNCEHFAYECYCGIHYSSQEEEAREKWSKIGFINVYLFDIDDEENEERIENDYLYKEVQNIRDFEERNARTGIFLKMKQALEHTLAKPFNRLIFKNKKGRTILDDCYFSYSHADNLGVIVTSNKPVGTDIENFAFFLKNNRNKTAKEMLNLIAHRNENKKETIEYYFQLLTEKKSVQNYLNNYQVNLKKINTKKYPLSFFLIKNNYYLVVCGENLEAIHFFGIEKDKVIMYKGKIEE